MYGSKKKRNKKKIVSVVGTRAGSEVWDVARSDFLIASLRSASSNYNYCRFQWIRNTITFSLWKALDHKYMCLIVYFCICTCIAQLHPFVLYCIHGTYIAVAIYI